MLLDVTDDVAEFNGVDAGFATRDGLLFQGRRSADKSTAVYRLKGDDIVRVVGPGDYIELLQVKSVKILDVDATTGVAVLHMKFMNGYRGLFVIEY